MATAKPIYQLATPTQVYDNIRTVEAQLRSCIIDSLPERYIWPGEVVENLKPANHETVAKEKEDVVQNLAIPVVDLAGIDSASEEVRARIAREMGKACEEWGFFQVINTAVPAAVMEQVNDSAREFFALPVEEMEKASEPPGKPLMGYGGRLSFLSSKVPWVEYLGEFHIPEPGVEALAKKVWEDGNPKFCKAITDYCNSAEQLGLLILELLAESLNLPKDTYSQHFQRTSGYQGSWRFNYYTRCPRASETVGQGPHSDPVALTILRQDQVPGLQVRKGNTWITAEPLSGAFVVNVGDFLQAWSNDRFKSVEHRAFVNEKRERLSMIYFMSPPPVLNIEAPSKLVPENQQSVYRTFTYAEYLGIMFQNRVTGDFSKKALDYMRRETATE
ncbi:hypothetical protein R1sor_008135 [Riccia sorocarpa]|uniref:Fe2OG dioxygenase domain-containing protein n=1 Tax=Riccia sorocarpa TaxID=122646 RepID=A0ABD3HVZ5_9MARC